MVSSTSTTDGAAKVYTCPVCARQFNKKANLKVHSRKHTGEKPYACSRPGCDRRFMWKSSVTFHEQNCVAGGRDALNSRDTPGVVRPVQKRHKMIHNAKKDPHVTTASLESPPRPHVTNIQNPGIIPTESMPSFSAPQDYRNPEYLHHAVQQTASSLAQHHQFLRLANASLQSQHAASLARQSAGLSTYSPLASYSVQGIPGTKATNMVARNAHVRTSTVDAHPTAMFCQVTGIDPYDVQKQFSSALSAPSISGSSHQSVSCLTSQPSSSLPPSFPTEANPLPAPSTIFDKHLSTGGRPPVIPPALPKPSFFQGNKNLASEHATKAEPVLTASSAKPPMMHGSKMKMPIAMDLDDSDDEGADRIIGAQETFMRTGNIFTGFAPPPRCSPLPASSPIVCPGISPMPLSPLAPFSPLPPDSPAHNAPNPVHPPLNQPVRSTNSIF